MPYPRRQATKSLFSHHEDSPRENPPTHYLIAHSDGGARGNPGPAGIGVVIDGCESGTVRIAKWIGNQDNNVAEYVALMEALQYAVSRKARKLHVYSDSQVVVRQMTG